MRCPKCGGEVLSDEIFCGHCGTRLEPVAPPTAPSAKRGGLPVVPVVIGVLILLVVGCLCVVGAGIMGLCTLPAFSGIFASVATEVAVTATPSRKALTPTPTIVPGFTVAPRPVTPRPPTEVVVTATPVRPPTPTRPALPPPGDVPLRVLSYAQSTTALNNKAVEIEGEAENTSGKEVDTGWYLVYVILKDKDGNVIPTNKDLTTNLRRPVMKPGQKSCFRNFFDAQTYGFDITQVDRLEAVVRQNPAGHDAYTVELTVSNVERSDRTITGDITNDTPYTTQTVFIYITLYDSEGRVVGVKYGTRIGDQQVKPGGTMGFTYTIIPSEAPNVASFDVMVAAYKAS